MRFILIHTLCFFYVTYRSDQCTVQGITCTACPVQWSWISMLKVCRKHWLHLSVTFSHRSAVLTSLIATQAFLQAQFTMSQWFPMWSMILSSSWTSHGCHQRSPMESCGGIQSMSGTCQHQRSSSPFPFQLVGKVHLGIVAWANVWLLQPYYECAELHPMPRLTASQTIFSVKKYFPADPNT